MELKRRRKVVLVSVFFTATMLSGIDLIIRRYPPPVAPAVPPHELEPVTIESCVGVEEPSDDNVRFLVYTVHKS